jgi:hypothetical protein
MMARERCPPPFLCQGKRKAASATQARETQEKTRTLKSEGCGTQKKTEEDREEREEREEERSGDVGS